MKERENMRQQLLSMKFSKAEQKQWSGNIIRIWNTFFPTSVSMLLACSFSSLRCTKGNNKCIETFSVVVVDWVHQHTEEEKGNNWISKIWYVNNTFFGNCCSFFCPLKPFLLWTLSILVCVGQDLYFACISRQCFPYYSNFSFLRWALKISVKGGYDRNLMIFMVI